MAFISKNLRLSSRAVLCLSDVRIWWYFSKYSSPSFLDSDLWHVAFVDVLRASKAFVFQRH